MGETYILGLCDHVYARSVVYMENDTGNKRKIFGTDRAIMGESKQQE